MASGSQQESAGSGLPGMSDGGPMPAIHGGVTKSKSGGTVYKVTDLDFVKRFLIIGWPDITADSLDITADSLDITADSLDITADSLDITADSLGPNCNEVAEKLESLIEKDKGEMVVDVIKEISTEYRNIRYDAVVFCLAYCARSDDKPTKRKAYSFLNDVCRTPSHLFKFIEYYTLLTRRRLRVKDKQNDNKDRKPVKEKDTKVKSQQKDIFRKNKEKNDERKKQKKEPIKLRKMNPHAAYGWGRSFKTAIQKWFLSFATDPEYLAYLLTKYRRRCGWSVKTVINLAHIKSPDTTEKQKAVGLILRYFRCGLVKAKEHYRVNNNDKTSIVTKVAKLLEIYDEVRRSTDVEFTIQKLKDAKENQTLTLEHISPKVLSSELTKKKHTRVWAYLIPCMPGEALIRHAGLLTHHGVFNNVTNDLENISEIRLKSFEERLQPFIDGSAVSRKYLKTQRPVHPFTLLLALIQYKKGQTTHEDPRIWTPNSKMVAILERAFEASIHGACGISGIRKKICVAIDVSESMAKLVPGPKTERDYMYLDAAAAVGYTFVKIGTNVDVIIFNAKGSLKMEIIDSTTFEKFKKCVHKCSAIDVSNKCLGFTEGADCSEPFRWSQEAKRSDIDAFVVLTVNQNVPGRIEPVEALMKYRNYCVRDDIRCVFCTMDASSHTMTTRADPRMLDICGFDGKMASQIEHFISMPIDRA